MKSKKHLVIIAVLGIFPFSTQAMILDDATNKAPAVKKTFMVETKETTDGTKTTTVAGGKELNPGATSWLISSLVKALSW